MRIKSRLIPVRIAVLYVTTYLFLRTSKHLIHTEGDYLVPFYHQRHIIEFKDDEIDNQHPVELLFKPLIYIEEYFWNL